VAVLARGDKWGELVILRGGHVAFTRSLTGQALASEAAMLGELRRNLAVFAGQSPQGPVQAVFVAEGEMPGGWAGRLRAALSVPVQAFDPIAGAAADVPPEARGCFAGLAGLAALRARSAELPVNFLEPRQPRQGSDPNKKMLAIIGAAAAVLLVAGLAYGLLLVSDKEKTRRALVNDKTSLEDELRGLEDVSKRVKAVRDWQDKGVNWLDELYDLTAAFPDPAGTEVVHLVGAPVEQSKGSKKKTVAEMQLTILTESSKAVQGTLTGQIQALNHREVALVQPKGATGPRNRKAEQYLVKVLIERVPPEKFTLQIDAPSYQRRAKPREDVPFDFGGGMMGGFGGFQ
jgi:hypothetical protein